MSDGNRSERFPPWVKALASAGLTLAAAALLGGLFHQIRYAQQAEYGAAEYARDVAYESYKPCRVAPIVKLNQCLADAKREYDLKSNNNRRDYADLVAQQRSALWTGIMGLAALIGMALSAVGVWLIWTTFRETRRTAQIAQAALEHERSNAKAVNRPWLIVERVNIGRIEDDGTDQPGAGGIYFQIMLKNFGSRPATEVYLLVDIIISDPNSACPEFPAPIIEDHHGFAGPGGFTVSSARAIPAATAEAWKRGECHLWFYAISRYGEPGISDRPYGMDVVYLLIYSGMAIGNDGHPVPTFHPMMSGTKNKLS